MASITFLNDEDIAKVASSTDELLDKSDCDDFIQNYQSMANFRVALRVYDVAK